MESKWRVFVAGASGTIGVPLVRALCAAGHHVTALTRTPEKQQLLEALGATPAVADALDATLLRELVMAARPTHVIHQLTALPKDGPRRASELEATNKLRREGTRYLLDAAVAAGARRFVGGSFALMQGVGPDASEGVRAAVVAVDSMESQILGASRTGAIEGVVLRYGLFYGSGNPATRRMLQLARRRLLPVVRGDASLLPCIHLYDAVSATVLALDRAGAGSVYDIVDDRPVSFSEIVRALAAVAQAPPPITMPRWVPRLLSPYLAEMTALTVRLSNERAKTELGWQVAYPTLEDGLTEALAYAA